MQTFRSLSACWALMVACVTGHAEQVSSIGRDEEIVFFPAFATVIERSDMWEAEVQGCVYEPEKRSLAIALLHQAIERDQFQLTPSQELVFKERVRLFMLDHERGESVVIQLGERKYSLGRSRADGRFSGRIQFRNADLVGQGSSNILRFQAVVSRGDPRAFSGEIHIISGTGVTVVSDIDDTIKISQVTNRQLLLKNTFLEPFQPVPGMANLYRQLADRESARFWYVSASPWQLFAPLSDFVRSNGYPSGIFCLKNVRWKDRSVLSLLDSPKEYKPEVIEPVLKRFPSRRFVLVGDSGEGDPEIYAALARQYPRQVERIYIRDTTGEGLGALRYRRLTNDIPAVKWIIFRSPAELDATGSTAYGKYEKPPDQSGQRHRQRAPETYTNHSR